MSDQMTVSGTAWEIAVEVAHKRIQYGEVLESQPDLLKLLKNAIFQAVRDELEERAGRAALSEGGENE